MGKIKKSTVCGAVVAAALFTPVPAIADVAPQARHLLQRAAHAAEAPNLSATVNEPAQMSPTVQTAIMARPKQAEPDLALSLISMGTIGLGLSLGGLVIVAARRRQY